MQFVSHLDQEVNCDLHPHKEWGYKDLYMPSSNVKYKYKYPNNVSVKRQVCKVLSIPTSSIGISFAIAYHFPYGRTIKNSIITPMSKSYSKV